MDFILSKASNQVVTFAIRSGISLASGFAIKTVSKFLDKIPDSEKRRIISTKNKIQSKIEILSISIDLIKLAAARGNTSLEATVKLINELNDDIGVFDETIDGIVNGLNNTNEKDSISRVEIYMKDLLRQIDEIIPMINLSLITCGVNLKGDLSKSISPGRLLQASNYLNISNSKHKGIDFTKVGPTFELKFYTIFYNPSRSKYLEDDETTGFDELSFISWKEEFPRSSARILRIADETVEYNYKFEITEDFDDGRYHEEDEKPSSRSYNIDLIKRLFFSASGKLLKLEGRNSPVLILKLIDNEDNEEWIALGEIEKGEFDDSDEDSEENSDERNDNDKVVRNDKFQGSNNTLAGPKYTSLSLLEYLIRLSKVQQTEQKCILNVTDEKLSLYLKDENEDSKNELIPKSAKEKQNDLAKSKRINDKITLDSNISRLTNLELDE